MTQPHTAIPLPDPDDIPRQLAAATVAWAKLRRAAGYASFDAGSLVILGALSLICGGYGSVPTLLVSLVLLAAGFAEFHSIRRLRRLDPRSLPTLAYNQLALAGGLILYALWSLIQIGHGGGILEAVNEQARDAGYSVSDPTVQATLVQAVQLVYAALIAFAVLVQGGTALFYLSRRKHLRNYLQQTPPWVQQMQRERGTVSL